TSLNGLEIACLIPLLLIVFWVGIYPQPVIDRIEPTVKTLLKESVVKEGTEVNPIIQYPFTDPGEGDES
ncbi:MAG: hypothetical protein ABEJ65_06835, partial [bacterium]